MEPRGSLRAVIAADDPAMGTMVKTNSAVMAEGLGYTALDFLLIDRQHGSPIMEKLEAMIRAADLHDLPMVVRIPRDDTSLVTFLLDTGVRGIMVPQVEDPETVRAVSSHMRYADGRSLASYSRAARFGNIPKDRYAEYVNNELALLPMIETAAGLEAVEAIARMEEVTALTIGPGDLAWSLGVEFDSPDHRTAIDRIFAAGAAQDCPVGLFTPSSAHVERYRDRAAFMVYSSDLSIVSAHLEDVIGSGG